MRSLLLILVKEIPFLYAISQENIVIDVGGRVNFSQKEPWQEKIASSNAERTLIPYLKSRGISKIDQLVVTHTDADHVEMRSSGTAF